MRYLIVLIFMTGCGWKMRYSDDNVAEEFLESVIEQQTGVEIDFTGDSQE